MRLGAEAVGIAARFLRRPERRYPALEQARARVPGMYDEADKTIRAELGPGERLVWAGRPRGGVRLTAADALMIPFSLVWCGFAVFWEKSALSMNAPGFFALWGLPFIGVGLYVVFGRFIADAVRRGKISYGLTDRRVIIVSGVFTRQVTSLDLAALGEITVSERPDRSGTIALGAGASPYAFAGRMLGPSWPGVARYLPPSLEMLDDVKTVYEKIRAQRGS
jgi:hypothetical protein